MGRDFKQWHHQVLQGTDQLCESHPNQFFWGNIDLFMNYLRKEISSLFYFLSKVAHTYCFKFRPICPISPCAVKREAAQCTAQSVSAVEKTSCCWCCTGGYLATKTLPKCPFRLSKQGKADDENRMFHCGRTDKYTVMPTSRTPMCSLYSHNVYVRKNYIIAGEDFQESWNCIFWKDKQLVK